MPSSFLKIPLSEASVHSPADYVVEFARPGLDLAPAEIGVALRP
jgi:hypothetical protein